MEERGSCVGRKVWWYGWKEVGTECTELSIEILRMEGSEEAREVDSRSEEEWLLEEVVDLFDIQRVTMLANLLFGACLSRL